MTIYGGPDLPLSNLSLHFDASSKKSYPFDDLDVEYLIVAGGGGGGGVIGGGGGAGGLLNGAHTAILANGTYAVVVGAGGAGGTGWNTSSQDGKVGGDSSVFSITSSGGGGGVHHGGATTSTTKNGGSGGGGANGGGSGGTGISGQGNNGGNNGDGNFGAGGGGAGSVGGNRNGLYGGNGGLGKYFGNKFGNAGYNGWFADGGSGGVRSYGGPIDAGVATNGGGNGTRTTTVAGNGSTNTGSGGGGGGYSASSNNRIGGNGGSGIVIIRYKGPQRATGGDSIFEHNGFTVHVFNSSGNFVVGEIIGGMSTNRRTLSLNNMNRTNRKTERKGSWSFDGSNEYLSLGESLLANKNEFTWQAFVKFNNMQPLRASPSYQLYIEESQVWIAQYDNAVGIDLRQSDNVWFDGQGGFAKGAQIGKNIICRNTWYHLAWTFDRYGNGGTSGQVKGYLDGELVVTVNTLKTGSIYNNNNNALIGWRSGATYFDGEISKFSLYDKKLTDKQIFRYYNSFRGKYQEDLSIYENVTYSTNTASFLAISNNGGKSVDMFKISSNNSWNSQYYTTQSFTAPCTIEFMKKAADEDNAVSYAMIGWNVDPTANASYASIDYAAYPFRKNLYMVYNNGSQIVPSPNKTWSSSEKFYIVYNTDGTLKHYNGSNLLYSVNYGTGKTVYLDSSFYSVNNIYGGFSNVRVAKKAWNGTAYV